MEENVQNEISLMDIVKMLVQKIKLLICITLIGGILGCAAGVVLNVNKRYYGTELSFYISERAADTEILSLLKSDSFSEQLLLDEHGLPVSGFSDSVHYTTALTKSLEAKNASKKIAELEESLETLPEEVEIAKKMYEESLQAYTEAFNRWEVYISSQNTNLDSTQQQRYQDALDVALGVKTTKQKEYDEKNNELTKKKAELTAAKKAEKAAKEEWAAAAAPILNEWRQDKQVKAQIKKIKKSVSYFFANPKNGTSQLLAVNVSVLKDKAFAQTLFEALKAKVPEYVAENIHLESTVVNGVQGEKKAVSVSFLSTFNEVERLNKLQTLKKAIIYAVVFALGAFVLGCVYVICADKWKRDVKQATLERTAKKEE